MLILKGHWSNWKTEDVMELWKKYCCKNKEVKEGVASDCKEPLLRISRVILETWTTEETPEGHLKVWQLFVKGPV